MLKAKPQCIRYESVRLALEEGEKISFTFLSNSNITHAFVLVFIKAPISSGRESTLGLVLLF